MPPRLRAFPSVGLPGCGLSQSWASPVSVLPSCGPSRLWAIPFVGRSGSVSSVLAFPVVAPSSYSPGVYLGLPFWRTPVAPSCPSGAIFRRAPGLFWTSGCLLPAALAKLPDFFRRMPVVFSRRFPFRRHFLGGSPFSWIYARLFWAGGWQLPAAPVKLAVFLLNGRPTLPRGVSPERTPSCSLG